jgi:hypothetical protein
VGRNGRLEQKKVQKERRAMEAKKDKRGYLGKKKDQLKKEENTFEDNSSRRKLELSEVEDEDMPINMKSIKVASMKHLQNLVMGDTTTSNWGKTMMTQMKKKESYTRREKPKFDPMAQTNTDSFNLEVMMGRVDPARTMTSGLQGAVRPSKNAMQSWMRKTDSKHLSLPRDRSQVVAAPTANIYDLMNPPVLGGQHQQPLFPSISNPNLHKL